MRGERGPPGTGLLPLSPFVLPIPACLLALGPRWPCTEADVRVARKRLAVRAHPDQGGDHASFVALTLARDEALLWLSTRRR